mmetsp:Transcript_10735/g.29848  ORF Transcript_10735/g.29848 Transcript_10735/m.29848 type:complete len:201 (-) Transcript_10735:2254-2856(-)
MSSIFDLWNKSRVRSRALWYVSRSEQAISIDCASAICFRYWASMSTKWALLSSSLYFLMFSSVVANDPAEISASLRLADRSLASSLSWSLMVGSLSNMDASTPMASISALTPSNSASSFLKLRRSVTWLANDCVSAWSWVLDSSSDFRVEIRDSRDARFCSTPFREDSSCLAISTGLLLPTCWTMAASWEMASFRELSSL